jgi:hypothetical protein
MAKGFNSVRFFVICHEQMPKLPQEACIRVEDGIKLAGKNLNR